MLPPQHNHVAKRNLRMLVEYSGKQSAPGKQTLNLMIYERHATQIG